MENGKTICVYLSLGNLARLDSLRGKQKRSVAINRAMQYILSQSDPWVQDMLGTNLVDASQ